MDKMEIVYVSAEKIKPYKNNPRDNKKAVDKVARSIKEYGFKVPCVLDKNLNIVTGHTRFEAAKKLGMKRIPCIIADDLNKQQVSEFRIADNRTAEYAKWDLLKLKEELSKIRIEDVKFDGNFDFDSEIEDIDIDELFVDEKEETKEKKEPKEEFIISIKCDSKKQYEKRINILQKKGWIE